MNGPIVIGHLLNSFGRGGMENVLVKLINSLDACTYRHVIVTVSGDVALSNNVKTHNVVFRTLTGKSVLGRLIELRRIAKEEGIDVLHARGWSLMLEGGLVGLMQRLPSVYSFHGKAHYELHRFSMKRWLAEMLSARMYDRIVTLTPAMRMELMETLKLPSESIKIIANGTPGIQFDSEDRKRVRRALGIDDRAFVAGFAGRFDLVKDMDTLVTAFARFAAHEPDSCLVLVGEGPCMEHLKALVRELDIVDKVLFTGFCDKVQDIMIGFDVYLQTSLYEGLSNTILEAMSAGLPVICTDVGGNGDIVQHGKNGILIAARDAEACTEGLAELFRKPELRRHMAGENLEKHRICYSLQSMTKQYDELYSTMFSV